MTELNNERLRSFGSTGRELLHTLTNFGFEVRLITPDGLRSLELDLVDAVETDLLATPAPM